MGKYFLFHEPKPSHPPTKPDYPLKIGIFSYFRKLATHLLPSSPYTAQIHTLQSWRTMSLSKLSLLTAAAIFTMSGAAAHADSLSVGTSVSSFAFSIKDNGHTTAEDEGGGNFVGTTAIINNKPVSFSAVYCVDLFDDIDNGGNYDLSSDTKGVVNGSKVNNAADIAWLIINLSAGADTRTESEALQAAIWATEYNGNGFSSPEFILSGNSPLWTDYHNDITLLDNAIAHGKVNSGLIADLDWLSP